MSNNSSVFIPPVQGTSVPGQTLGGQPQQGQPQGQQEQPQGQDGQPSTEEVNMILLGGLVEALVSKGVISEEDVHNGIASLQEGGAPTSGPDQKGKGDGSPGFPNGADIDKGMGNEAGKFSK